MSEKDKTPRNQSGNTESAAPAQAAIESPSKPIREALELPKGDVLLRKVKGSDGTHHWLGYVKVGRVYTCGARAAVYLIEGGEFQVFPEYADDVAQAIREKKSRQAGGTTK